MVEEPGGILATDPWPQAFFDQGVVEPLRLPRHLDDWTVDREHHSVLPHELERRQQARRALVTGGGDVEVVGEVGGEIALECGAISATLCAAIAEIVRELWPERPPR
jgi:hypothetical protein